MNEETKERLRFYLKKYRWIIAIYILAIAVFIFGNRSTFEMYQLSQDRHSPGIITSKDHKTIYPLTITDLAGREVSIAKVPERLVSLASFSTEILYYLGASDRIVGVGAADAFAPNLKNLPQLGNSDEPSVEEIINAKPDLVFAADLTTPEQIAALEKAGLAVVMLEAHNNPSKVNEAITKTAQITDTQKEGRDVITTLQNKSSTK